jgi:hypothetical protein
MENSVHEINISRLTERINREDDEIFKGYRFEIVLFMQQTGNILFADQIYARDKESAGLTGITPEDYIASNSHRFFRFGSWPRTEDAEEWEDAYIDMSIDLVIKPNTPCYANLFPYQLAYTDILAVDQFLDYTYETYYKGRFPEFSRFVLLQLRKNMGEIIPPEIIETAKEWVAGKEKILTTEHKEAGETKAREKFKREPGDNLTKLKQEQTALFFYYLQSKGVILRNDLLNNTEMGQALSLMTGYSADALRQDFSKKELSRIASKKNLNDLINILVGLNLLITKDLKDKK